VPVPPVHPSALEDVLSAKFDRLYLLWNELAEENRTDVYDTLSSHSRMAASLQETWGEPAVAIAYAYELAEATLRNIAQDFQEEDT